MLICYAIKSLKCSHLFLAVDGRGDPLDRHHCVSSDMPHLFDDTVSASSQIGNLFQVIGLHLESPIIDCDGCASVEVSRRSKRLNWRLRWLQNRKFKSRSGSFGHPSLYFIKLNSTLSRRARQEMRIRREVAEENFPSSKGKALNFLLLRGLTVRSWTQVTQHGPCSMAGVR